MPWVPGARCATPGCTAMEEEGCRGHCQAHKPIGWYERPSQHTLKVDARTFGRIRRRMLRGRPKCVICLERPATDIDHIVPVSRGGALYARENLQALCSECHDLKTQGEALEDAQSRKRRSNEPR